MQETIKVQGIEITVITDDNKIKWVALKPICDAIGVDWKSQHSKIKNNSQFNHGDITTTGADGKSRIMTCLPINQFHGWLFTINANRVKPKYRNGLIAYQNECQKALVNQSTFGLIPEVDSTRGHRN